MAVGAGPQTVRPGLRVSRAWDIALVEQGGEITVHVADCQEVRELAEQGVPVVTMIGCQELPHDLPFAVCLRTAILGGEFP